MSATVWVVVAAAVVVAWPVSGGLRRLGPRAVRLPSPGSAGLRAWALRSPTMFTAAGGSAGVALGAPAGGPVAAVLGGVYATLGGYEFAGWAARRRAAQRRALDLEELSAVAGDLRAGAAPGAGLGSLGGRLGELAGATERLAAQTGAPMADLVERIEADARSADRGRATAAAEAAGVQTTALLLMLLPLIGLALGYSIGSDPLGVLLHSPVGAACAIAAALLQSAGLLWSDRLIRGPRS